jgi:hypothetical protein
VAKLTPQEVGLFQLIARSPDIGDGWRQASSVVWTLVESFTRNELIEKDVEKLRVRLSPRGQIVSEYLV